MSSTDPAAPRRFFVADLNVRGEALAVAEYRYEDLERVPGAADLIVHLATNLYRSPEAFETVLPLSASGMSFRWQASAETAGVASSRTRGGELASLGLLASGLNAEADRLTFAAFQQHLMTELRDTGYEPAFDLVRLRPRPIVASFDFATEAEEKNDQLVLALVDRCFAAAYFRYLGLA